MTTTPRRWTVTYTQTHRAVVTEPDVAAEPADNFPDRQAAALLDLARQTPSLVVEDSAKFQEAHPVPGSTSTRPARRQPLAVAVENAECDPFTRKRLPAATVTAALAELDEERALVAAALTAFQAQWNAAEARGAGYVSEPLGDAWNALHDAADALDRLRARIEDNPRPIPEHERGTYELVMQNID